MENLAKAILTVMSEVKGIEKNSNVGTGSYAYKGVNDQDVKRIIGESMQKNGLCILPIEIEPTIQIDRWTETYNGQEKQKQNVFTEVKTKYLLLHESGESMTISGYGHGVDSQDKSAGKATTYALKYALLYAFMTPTGAIDDADKTHSNDIDVPAKVNGQSNGQSNGKANAAEPTEWLNLFTKDGEQTKTYFDIAKAFDEGKKLTLAGIRKKYKVSKKTAEELKTNFNIV